VVASVCWSWPSSAALVLIREDPDAANFDAVFDGIVHSRSDFEHYMAIDAAEWLLRTGLDPSSRGCLRDSLLAQTGPGGWIDPTTDR
jgi:hypothetical protein